MTRLAFSDEGEGDPLVLVHAEIADARMWEPQVARFAGEWRVDPARPAGLRWNGAQRWWVPPRH